MMEVTGPVLWAEWHRRALRGDPKDGEAERAWLKHFARRIPCIKCRTHFQALVNEHFEFGFANYFNKTVAVHNVINQERGVPMMTIASAVERWS